MQDNIRALSLKQPFASLIVNGRKKIELRTWNTSYRGWFWVHASLTPYTKKEYLGIIPDKEAKGAIIGLAEILDVKKYKNKEEFYADRDLHCASNPNRFHDPLYGFIIGRTIKIDPIKCKGSLNFFKANVALDIEKYLGK
ncbi:ASCH domain-containing protein [Candidatus Gracilibacteria bacterium]|nr:ASCH domain-containing protein [Candidatus Gracilibacteria bacterium]